LMFFGHKTSTFKIAPFLITQLHLVMTQISFSELSLIA
jgi:hypothetical protein